MRAHKSIKDLKEQFDYNFNDVNDKEIEEITQYILNFLGINRVRTPIADITNKLGFTIYNIPFEKEECSENIHGLLGVGIEFSMNENSSFFMVEKNLEDEDKRFFIAYLLAHYLLYIDERTTDCYNFRCHKNSIKNSPQTRLALSLLMPEEIFMAQWEFLTMAYITSHKEQELNKKFIIHKMAKIFQVTDKIIQARLLMLDIK